MKLPALLSILFLAAASFAADQPADRPTTMSERGRLLFSDDFAGDAPKPEWGQLKGKWAVANGALRGTEVETDNHAAVTRNRFDYRNAVFQFTFKLDGCKTASLSLNNQEGHVCRVILTAKDFTVQRDKPNKNTDAKAAKLDTKEAKLADGQWHTMVVEVVGGQMLAKLDDKVVAFGEHPGIDADKKDFGFTVTGSSLLVKRVRVWEAAPKKDFDKKKLVAARN
ncbi:MAG: hypothetical protein HY300_16975 [Verrucomicrobia bacterium]|nr:hypothetical protein [Verrucomicrobiota bacterium]